jgi:hypothetical protein
MLGILLTRGADGAFGLEDGDAGGATDCPPFDPGAPAGVGDAAVPDEGIAADATDSPPLGPGAPAGIGDAFAPGEGDDETCGAAGAPAGPAGVGDAGSCEEFGF